MRLLLMLLPFVCLSLAGCVDDGPAPLELTDNVRWYRVAFDGSDVATDGAIEGLVVVTNYGFDARVVELTWTGAGDGAVSRFKENFTTGSMEELSFANGVGVATMAPGERLVFAYRATSIPSNATELGWSWSIVAPVSEEVPEARLIRTVPESWPISHGSGAPVAPGDVVVAATIGFLSSGSGFTSNIQSVLSDANFPRDPLFLSMEARATLEPFYVYDEASSEMPLGLADNCMSVTVPGLNTLVKSQVLGETRVVGLQPSEAYTQAGNEDHRLYDEPLIFMQTVLENRGPAETTDELPDPDGACHDPLRVCPRVFGGGLCPDASTFQPAPEDP